MVTDRLYAPWRIEWVEREDDPIDGCPFCVLPERDADRESRILARSAHNFVILNNAPYNPGHAMVIPHEHTDRWETLDDKTLLDHARLKAETFRAMREELVPNGFNSGLNLGGGAAGGSIGDHLHTHIVPRWEGDTNFMPVVADTTVIVEAVDRSYDRLHEAFAELPGAEDVGEDQAVEFSFAE